MHCVTRSQSQKELSHTPAEGSSTGGNHVYRPDRRMDASSPVRKPLLQQLSQWETALTLNSCSCPVDFGSGQPLLTFSS